MDCKDGLQSNDPMMREAQVATELARVFPDRLPVFPVFLVAFYQLPWRIVATIKDEPMQGCTLSSALTPTDPTEIDHGY